MESHSILDAAGKVEVLGFCIDDASPPAIPQPDRQQRCVANHVLQRFAPGPVPALPPHACARRDRLRRTTVEESQRYLTCLENVNLCGFSSCLTGGSDSLNAGAS